MKKYLLLFMVVLVLCIGLMHSDGNTAAGNQSINSLVLKDAILPELNEDAVSTQNTTSGNATVMLKNPSFKEMKEFILKDKTSQNQFITNKYECRHFATDVNNNADIAGIRCAMVLLCYKNGQHAVVAFETTDRGMVYIEPQTDAAIKPEIGGKYQDQEIVEILVSW